MDLIQSAQYCPISIFKLLISLTHKSPENVFTIFFAEIRRTGIFYDQTVRNKVFFPKKIFGRIFGKKPQIPGGTVTLQNVRSQNVLGQNIRRDKTSGWIKRLGKQNTCRDKTSGGTKRPETNVRRQNFRGTKQLWGQKVRRAKGLETKGIFVTFLMPISRYFFIYSNEKICGV
jgi:hypothetical protein